MDEMRRFYARFKENGKGITVEEFKSIFVTFGRNSHVALAPRVFTLFDRRHTYADFLSFSNLFTM